MNDRLQIYVNYSLIVFKMKKITLLFFTFLGICGAFAQAQIKSAGAGNLISKQNTDTTDRVEKRPLTKIFPNPARNKIEIEIRGFEPGYIKIQLHTADGKLLREEQRMVLTGNETILFMFFENPGSYYITARQGKWLTKNKLIIQ